MRVHTLVAVGTPHAGTPLANDRALLSWVNRLTGLATLAPDPLSDLAAAVATVLAHAVEGTVGALVGFVALSSGENDYLAGLRELAKPTSATYVYVAGDLRPTADDPYWRVIRRWAANQVLDGDRNDLFVGVDSALARDDEWTDGHADASLVVTSGHHDLFRSPEVHSHLRHWLLDEPAPDVAPSATGAVAVRRQTAAEPATAGPGAAASAIAADPSRARTVRVDPSSAAGERTAPGLTVSLLHASLEHAGYPVLVGHFAGSPLSGAEERLDDCLENRLSRAQVARDYPEALGEFRHFPGYVGTPPPGAIVVGLGPVGELTESQLASVVTRSLVRYASEARDRSRSSVTTREGDSGEFDGRLGLASVLIGTSVSSGLAVEGSIRGIIAGVVAANRRLTQIPLTVSVSSDPGGATRPIAFVELQFVARHEDMVELAALALEQLDDEQQRHEGDHSVSYAPRPEVGEGATGPNPPNDSANDVWARVAIGQSTIEPDGRMVLAYALMARQARADQMAHTVDRSLVDRLIEQSISRTADPRVGATLYELLVPHDLKQPIGTGSHLHLLLDETTADMPWELLTPRDEVFRDSRPLALGAGLLRQFAERRDIRQGPVRAPERAVLVIGNPPPGPDLAPLPGAAAEADQVVDAFRAAAGGPPWQVTARIWDSRGRYVGTTLEPGMTTEPSENVVHELMTGSWRVLHIAAHGVIDPEGDIARSGVVIGPGSRLTPDTIGQLSVVPDLVVVNACHLAAISRQLKGMNRVAASFARRLMQIGVRAVIAAGWAVNDRTAASFAQVLYTELLAGRELGEAVREARTQVYDEDPRGLTWGAYQCYGDPGFRLAPRRHQVVLSSRPSLTVSELRRRIRATAGMESDRTSSVSVIQRGIAAVTELAAEAPENDTDLVTELERLEDDRLYLEANADLKADIAADLGAAWAELGRFDRAVERYRSAIGGGGKQVPLVAVEQLVNLCVRLARERGGDEQTALLDEADKVLGALEVLGKTGERVALRGSFYKKRACMRPDVDRDDVIRAADCYRRAYALQPKAYHENNARQLAAIVSRWTTDVDLTVGFDPDTSARSRDVTPVDFWGRSGLADGMLTRLVEKALLARPYDGTVVEMATRYAAAFELRSTGPTAAPSSNTSTTSPPCSQATCRCRPSSRTMQQRCAPAGSSAD